MKNFFSKVSVLALVASFFVVPLLANAATTPTTSTSITNTVPAFTVQPVESWTQAYTGSGTTDARAESSTTYPTNEGTNVTITATAVDPNADSYYLAVCKTTIKTPGGANLPPTCDTSQEWAISTETVSGSAASVSFTTTGLSSETYIWYAFVCDKTNSAGSLCSDPSLTSQGGTQAEVGASANPAGSPFHVNHRPTFTAGTIVDSGNGTIAPGDTVKFVNSADADGDLNGTQDTITMYVCGNETDMGGATTLNTGFDFKLNTCTGGLMLCYQAGVNPLSADATCNDDPTGTGDADVHTNIVSIPTANADYSVNVYVKDSHGFASTSTAAKDLSVIDVAPVLDSYTTTDAYAFSVGASDTVTRDVAFHDDNGDNDPTALDMVLFEDVAVADTCTADDNDCVRKDAVSIPAGLAVAGCSTSTRSTAGTGKTALGTDKDITISCDFTVWYNALPSLEWNTSATVTDGIGAVNFADSVGGSNDIGNNAGLNVNETTIAYGTVALGSKSTSGAGNTTTLQNYGNQVMDVGISGTDMSGTPSGTIESVEQKWYPTSAEATNVIDWDTYGFILRNSTDPLHYSVVSAYAETNGCSNRNLAVRNDHTIASQAEDEQLLWMIKIPATQVAGSYSGTNTFTLAASTFCSAATY